MLSANEFKQIIESKHTLSPDEERQVFAYYEENHTTEVRNQIALKNDLLIKKIANGYGHLGVELEELFQEGYFGLMIAIDRFDYKAGFKFSTYASHWINNVIGRYIINNGHMIRLPVYLKDLTISIYKLQKQYEQEHGCRPTEAYLAEKLGVSIEQIQKAQQAAKSNEVTSLNVPVGENKESGDTELISMIPDSQNDIADSVIRDLDLEKLNKILENVLTLRETVVLNLRYGLNNERKMTLMEIGELYGLTRERIRQIEASALRKLSRSRYRNELRSMIESIENG